MASNEPKGSSMSSTSASWPRARARADPLAHSARELVGPPGSEALEVDHLQQGAHQGPTLAARHPAQLEGQRDVAAHGEPGEQRRLLEHEGGAALDVDRAGGGESSPASRWRRVLLPHPDAPTRQTNSPCLRSS